MLVLAWASTAAGWDGPTVPAGVGLETMADGGVPRTRSQRQRDDRASQVSRQMRLSTPVTLPPDRAVPTTGDAADAARGQGVAIEESGTGRPRTLDIVPVSTAPASTTGAEAFGFDSAA